MLLLLFNSFNNLPGPPLVKSPSTMWTGNSNQEITVNQGNIVYNKDILYNTNIPYNGAAESNLILNYSPKPSVWIETNQ